MFIVGMNFIEVLNHLPKNEIIAELGVKTGRNARRMFEVLDPKMMHLVDPWAKDFDVGYAARHTPEERDYFVEYFNRMTKWSKSEEAGGKINVIRDYAIEASVDFEDKYFDFVYVDTLDTYDGYFGDLCAYAPKMKDDGILSGDDYYDLCFAVNKKKVRDPKMYEPEGSLVMINAANDFCDKCGWEILFITDEYATLSRPPRFFAGKKGVFGKAHLLLDQVLRVTPWAVEVSNPRDIRQTMYQPHGSTDINERRFFTKL
ncbi:MAG: class I SAM-dependent methyltransferase [Alphaproteobacteria bacterium]|nr:class I SAM-dependent methyltransferase [Alphaproteobacteria bacterium]